VGVCKASHLIGVGRRWTPRFAARSLRNYCLKIHSEKAYI